MIRGMLSCLLATPPHSPRFISWNFEVFPKWSQVGGASVLAFQSSLRWILSSLDASCSCKFFSVVAMPQDGQLRKPGCHWLLRHAFLCCSGLFLEFISLMFLGHRWQDVNGFLTGQTAVWRGVKFSVKSSVLLLQMYLQCKLIYKCEFWSFFLTPPLTASAFFHCFRVSFEVCLFVCFCKVLRLLFSSPL